MDSTKTLARRAGWIYLLLGITAPFGLEIAPDRLFVLNDAAKTMANVRAHETMLRFAIGSELFHQAVGVYLVLALYRLFKPVDAGYARQLVALGALVSVPIMFLNVTNEIAAILLGSGAAWLGAFNGAQLDALGYLFVRLHGYGVLAAAVFWGLWLFPFGILVVRSGFIPKWIGISLWLAGAGYVAQSTARFVFPAWAPAVGQVTGILMFAELPIIFWLAIWGARTPRATAATAAATA